MFYLIIKLGNKLFSPSSFPWQFTSAAHFGAMRPFPVSEACRPNPHTTETSNYFYGFSQPLHTYSFEESLKRRQDDPESIRGKWSWLALKHSHVISDISRRELRTCYNQHKIIIYNSQGRQYRSLWINIYVVTVHWFLSFATKFVYRWEKLSLGLLDH